MPMYVFENTETGELVEKLLPMSEVENEMIFDGVKHVRNLKEEMKGFNVNRTDAKPNSLWPKYSASCGIPPSEVSKDGHYKDPEKRRRFPEHRFNKKGRMRFGSRRQMERHMKDIGMESP
jgi:hypothetical protein